MAGRAILILAAGILCIAAPETILFGVSGGYILAAMDRESAGIWIRSDQF